MHYASARNRYCGSLLPNNVEGPDRNTFDNFAKHLQSINARKGLQNWRSHRLFSQYRHKDLLKSLELGGKLCRAWIPTDRILRSGQEVMKTRGFGDVTEIDITHQSSPPLNPPSSHKRKAAGSSKKKLASDDTSHEQVRRFKAWTESPGSPPREGAIPAGDTGPLSPQRPSGVFPLPPHHSSPRVPQAKHAHLVHYNMNTCITSYTHCIQWALSNCFLAPCRPWSQPWLWHAATIKCASPLSLLLGQKRKCSILHSSYRTHI